MPDGTLPSTNSFPQKEVARSVPEPKDLVLGIMGSSGAIAGLLLIFSGFLFGEAASLPRTTDDAILDKLQRSARMAIIPFCGFLATTLLSTIWLIHPSPCVYWLNTVFFLVLVVATGIYGVWASYR
jgi:hypothetical protein